MKVYIAGKISGLPSGEVEQKFSHAEWLLEDIGVEPVNPLKNGLNRSCSWNQHIARDVALLLECDGILMLTDWKDSKGASIEYFIANKQEMTVLFESVIAREHEVVTKIQDAIYEVTGMSFDDYSIKGRYRDRFFARVVFAHHCHMNNIDVIRYINRDRTVIYHYLKTYRNEMKVNSEFRDMATRVADILNPKNE
jgi:phenolic acid decarboxylase